MTSPLYTKLLATATRLLASKGQPITLTQQPVNGYNPVDSSTSVGSPADTPAVGVILDYSDRTFAAVANDDASLVQRGDRKIILAVSPLVLSHPIQPGDKATVGADVWTVINVKALNPGGLTVIYTLQVRL